MLRSSLTFLAIIVFTFGSAQSASIQDCLGAIPVCQQIYEETLAPVGSGNMIDFESNDVCLVGEANSIWYTFTVNESGKFGFLLTPIDPNQDYDWILFDITSASCEDLLTGSEFVVSCNAAGTEECDGATGATGGSEFNNQGPNCGNFPPSMNSGFSSFNDLVDVQAGNTYVLCILNFSAASSQGYTLDFGLSADIGIFDVTPPNLSNVNYTQSCFGQEIAVQFSEFIQCPTISDANFELTGTGEPYTLSLSSVNCDAGGNYSKEFFLTVNPAIPFGADVNLSLVVDGVTEALDLCGNPSQPGTLNFGGPTLTEPLDLGPDTTICGGEGLRLEENISGGYFWQDGSNFPFYDVTDSGTYWLTINTACGSLHDTIVVTVLDTELANGVLGNDTIICASESLILDATSPDATYLWQDGSTGPTLSINQPGTYAVSVTNECGEAQDEIIVSLPEPITATIEAGAICTGETIVYDVTTPNATYLWQDGSTDPVFTVTSPGTYSVVISNGCEQVELSAEVAERSGALPVIDLGNDTTLCAGENLLLEVDGQGASIVWQDGSTNTSFLVEQAGNYSVTVSNECGEVQDEIAVSMASPLVASLNDTTLCQGESVVWDVTNEGATYQWQDGSANPTFTATQEGTYTVIISNTCEQLELTAVVQESAGALSSIDLGQDTSLCPGGTLLLEVEAPGAAIQWQDGSTNSSFLVDQAGVYSVIASNECGEVQDEISVELSTPLQAELFDGTLCEGESIVWDVTNEGATYQWQDGSANPTFTATTPGTYNVIISNSCEQLELSAEVQASAGALPTINLGQDANLCPGESLLLEVDAQGADIQWQDGSTNNSFLVEQAGHYSVTASNECGNISDSIRVNYRAPISIDLGQDTVLCPGQTLLLDATNENVTTYAWQNGSPESSFQTKEPGTYSVLASNECEEVMASINVEACEICEVYVPNAFSPNNDGKNDFFRPFLSCNIEAFNLKVFDRWGALVYETTSIESGWDGRVREKTGNVGVYIYFIKLSVLENNKVKNIDLSGSITIL